MIRNTAENKCFFLTCFLRKFHIYGSQIMLICWWAIWHFGILAIVAKWKILIIRSHKSVDLLIGNFSTFSNSENLNQWFSKTELIRWLAVLALSNVEKWNFEPIALENRVDLLITNWHYLRLAILQICVWVQNLLIRWLKILAILPIGEKSNFEPIALQNGVDLLIINTATI